MKLIDILVQYLPGQGGWPSDDVRFQIVQASNGKIYGSKHVLRDNISGKWKSYDGACMEIMPKLNFSLADDHEKAVISKGDYAAALAAAHPGSKKEWTGKGMPPVGILCEVLFDHDRQEWLVAKIIGHDGTGIVGRWTEGEKIGELFDYGDTRDYFRPICSEADKKRDESLCAMRNCVSNFNNTSVIHAIGQVYDAIAAGKIPGIRVE